MDITVTVKTANPKVKLLAYTQNPYDLSVASARTCYSPRVIVPEEITEGQRERIGKPIYEAGHHTPFTHATFVFGLENVSRHFVWSFLHSHPFYNSDQSSQRYVVLDEARVFTPPVSGKNGEIYRQAVEKAWTAYNKISASLKKDFKSLMTSLGKAKNLSAKQIETEADKKAIENARYVVPTSAFTSLYHTISGIVLLRYVRMMNTGDCPYETNLVVKKMVAEVKKVDPHFFKNLRVEPLAETLEDLVNFPKSKNWAKEFDQSLGGEVSKLISYDKNAEKIVANSIREVLGVSYQSLDDELLIDMVLDPAKNPYLLDTLNSWVNSPLMRALNNVHYTFRKKLSHTADSQDQRHRMCPASRPLLAEVANNIDYITPDVIANNKEVKKLYDQTMETLFEAKNKLIKNGCAGQDACYLLPNAVTVRFTETGSLLHWLHKWRLRLCFNAQEEIYKASLAELRQVQKIHPKLTKFIGPPCFLRKGLVQAKKPEGPCPEGVRWCGMPVWLNFPKVKRPF